ncbi:phosphoesterase [Xylariaceae sp. FL0016]|nr:phosphoesterase [Xylariaceae sp. FL0016]
MKSSISAGLVACLVHAAQIRAHGMGPWHHCTEDVRIVTVTETIISTLTAGRPTKVATASSICTDEPPQTYPTGKPGHPGGGWGNPPYSNGTTPVIKGKAFDRILSIWLETTAYNNSIADPNCAALIDHGILLTRNYGVGAPSSPNYIAPASGDDFGLNHDSYIVINKNVSTIVDLLEDKGISWVDYNQGLEYTGSLNYTHDDAVEGNYALKHNLLARFDSIRQNPERRNKLQNLTDAHHQYLIPLPMFTISSTFSQSYVWFYNALDNEALPQWSFVTPNLYNDGHDTNVSVSCNFTRYFVEDLLQNKYFNDGHTLIYITWQANGQYPTESNHVAGILIGDAIPQELVGTTDDAYYNHYSWLASIEANFGLHTLGRWDVGANVWRLVGSKTGDEIRTWDPAAATSVAVNHDAGFRREGDYAFDSYLWNQTYGGLFSSDNHTTHTYVAPDPDLVRNGRTVLPAVAGLWRGSALPSYYADVIELPDAFHPPPGFQVGIPLMPPMPIVVPLDFYPYADPYDYPHGSSGD